VRETAEIVIEVLQGCASLGLLIFLLYLRSALAEERRRARSQAGAIEDRFKQEFGRLSERLAGTDELARKTVDRVHDAEVGIAGIEPQLQHLSGRIEEMSERVKACATRDDVTRVSSTMEKLFARFEGRIEGRMSAAARKAGEPE